jgi:hypothetical protein
VILVIENSALENGRLAAGRSGVMAHQRDGDRHVEVVSFSSERFVRLGFDDELDENRTSANGTAAWHLVVH